MESKIIKEQPLYSYYGCCADEDFGDSYTIELYKEDLINVEVGKEWWCHEQDRYPNRTHEWTVTARVIHVEEDTIYLHCFSDDQRQDDYDELLAIELHQKLS